MANILELFNAKTTLDYIQGREFQTYNEGEALFPEQKFDTLEFDYFVGANDMPVAAKIHAFDTEAEIGSLEAFKQALEAAYIKKKYQITEKDLIALRQPMSERSREMLTTRIFNVLEKAVADVRSTVEIMRMQAVANGQLDLEVYTANGTPATLTLDYGVPANHKEVLAGLDTWDNPTADILGDIQRWADTLDVRPTRAITSRKVLGLIMKNQNVVNALYGTGATRIATPGDLNLYLQGIGLPQVFAYAADAGQNYSYRKQAADGTYTTVPYFPENKFVLLPPNALGQTLYGPTPDEGDLIDEGKITEFTGNVIGYYYKSNQDPIGTWAKAASTAIPSFPEAGNVFQAQVTA
jgi:hypothetical protein